MRDGAESQKRAVVLDGGRGVAALVGDHGEVVVGAGVARIDDQRAAQQVPRFHRAAGGPLNQRQIDERFDVARIGRQRDPEFRGGVLQPVAAHQRHTEVVVRFHVPRIDRDRPLELLDRFVVLTAVLIQQSEIVVHLGARIVLLQQRSVLHQRVVEVADALVVERQPEVIRLRSDRRQ